MTVSASSSGDRSRANLLVRGKVQGVFFRATTLETAQRLRLTGWVQNLPDGRVEIMVEGPRRTVEELIAWAHVGPPMADVEQVEVRWEQPRHEFETFRIEY
jgi:acylphosphatase